MTADHLKTDDPRLEAMRQRFMQPKFISLAELLENPATSQPLVKGVLEAQSLAALVGPSGEAKSFIRTTLEMAVATGRPWNSHQVKRQGHVIRMLGEGCAGEIGRSLAHLRHHGLTIDDARNVHVSTQTLSMSGDNVDEIVAEIKQMGVDVALITIDTVHRHLEGDENSARDMGEFIRAADKLREELNATILLVHHSGHDKTRARGSSSFYAALDTEIFCNQGRLVFTKTKNSEPPQPIEFKLRPVQIGVDADGEPMTSCVVEFGSRSEKVVSESLTALERLAVDALVQAAIEKDIHHNGLVGALVGDWRVAYYAARQANRPAGTEPIPTNTMKQAFRRVIESLEASGIVKPSGEAWYLTGNSYQQKIQSALSVHGTSAVHGGTCNGDIAGTHGTHPLGCTDVPVSCTPKSIHAMTDENSSFSGWESEVPLWQR